MAKKHDHPEQPWVEGPWPDRCAPGCDDQLPNISRVGRGLRGDGFRVDVKSDAQSETYLEGLRYDAATGTWSSEWVSANVNGGQLMYQYNLRPYTIPQTFTITFRYKRPNRSASEWVWTTPAIPYIWDADNDGLADVDEIVGTGVAALFLKKTTESTWNYPTVHSSDYPSGITSAKHDKLLYPDDWTREMFNAPAPGDPWSVNLQYGIGGDLDAPNVDDIAKLLGITVQQVRNIINNQTGQIVGDGFTGNNMKDYVDKLCQHIHNDMGFDHHLVGDDNDVTRNTIKKYIDGLRADLYKSIGVADPSSNSYSASPDLNLSYKKKYGNKAQLTNLDVKEYIDARCDDLQEGLTAAETRMGNIETNITNMGNKYKKAIEDILDKVYGGGSMNATTGAITWGKSGKIPMGNLNIFAGTDTPTDGTDANAIRSRSLSDNDIAFK